MEHARARASASSHVSMVKRPHTISVFILKTAAAPLTTALASQNKPRNNNNNSRATALCAAPAPLPVQTQNETPQVSTADDRTAIGKFGRRLASMAGNLLLWRETCRQSVASFQRARSHSLAHCPWYCNTEFAANIAQGKGEIRGFLYSFFSSEYHE